MELDAEFIPDALIILEQVVRDKPKWHHFKFFWAVSLRLLDSRLLPLDACCSH